MWLNVSGVLYRTMQSCRHSLDSTPTLVLMARTVLADPAARRQPVIPLPPSLAGLPSAVLEQVTVPAPMLDAGAEGDYRAGNLVWAVGEAVLPDLERYWTANELLVVRALGYALHVLPRQLYRRAAFDSAAFAFNLSIVGPHWMRLSQTLRTTLCDLMQMTPDDVERLIATPGWCTPWG
jgi:hypothetical protein